MKPIREILEESLSYYNVEGLVQEGSRLEMAIINAMSNVAELAFKDGRVCGEICQQNFLKDRIKKRMDELGESTNPLDGEKMVALEELMEDRKIENRGGAK